MWHEYHTGGEDWFTSFMKRNQCLSLKKAKATSQARAARFNYPVVHSYQETLVCVFVRHQYPPDRIIYIDETSNQTVMAPETVVAIRGTKQINIVIRFIFESIAAIHLFHLLRFVKPPVLSEELIFL
jgi:hypothetical protein